MVQGASDVEPQQVAASYHLGALLEASLERRGTARAVWFEGEWSTASDLLDRQRRATGGLRELGVEPGDRVVVMMSNGPDVSVVYGAIWRAGAVVTPLVFLVSQTELEHVLSDSGAVAAITTAEFLPKVAAAAANVSSVRHVILIGAPDPAADGTPVVPFDQLLTGPSAEIVPRAGDDLGALMYTGGTTGRAKGVMLSHANLWWCSRGSYEKGRAEDMERSRSLMSLPLSHAYGLIVTLIGAHRQEDGEAILMRWFDPGQWLKLVDEFHPEMSPLVPSMISSLLQQPLESYDLSSLDFVHCGSAPLPPAIQREWERRVPNSPIMNGYGCTESGAVIATSTLSVHPEGAVGTAIPYCEIRILTLDGPDELDHDAAPGGAGEVCVRGPGIMQGYWHAPEATAEALQDGWLHTGDVGYLDSEGVLVLVDRKKDLIIRSGFNVFPRDVEDALLTHPDITGAAVVGRPDDAHGEEVVAFVALRSGAGITEQEIREYARSRLAATKYPREVHIIEAIPLTSVGKTDRKALRAQVPVETAIH
jgi:long-chain acyl-CoA synthetase